MIGGSSLEDSEIRNIFFSLKERRFWRDNGIELSRRHFFFSFYFVQFMHMAYCSWGATKRLFVVDWRIFYRLEPSLWVAKDEWLRLTLPVVEYPLHFTSLHFSFFFPFLTHENLDIDSSCEYNTLSGTMNDYHSPWQCSVVTPTCYYNICWQDRK